MNASSVDKMLITKHKSRLYLVAKTLNFESMMKTFRCNYFPILRGYFHAAEKFPLNQRFIINDQSTISCFYKGFPFLGLKTNIFDMKCWFSFLMWFLYK
jgi:hypothetical protein